MRTAIIFCGLVPAASAFTQPVLQFSELSLSGSFFDLYAVVDPGTCDFDLDGPMAEWDYTSAQVDLVGAAIFTDPAFTPYAAQFPDADLAMQLFYGQSITYNYYDIGPASLSVIGNGIGGSTPTAYTDPLDLLVFPLSYGEQFTDAFTANGTPGTLQRQYSGYGTVELVTGIFDNIAKVSASNGELYWWKSGPVEPLLSINTMGLILVWERLPIGIAEERGLVPLLLAPNPASGFFRFPGRFSMATFRVYDAAGRLAVSGSVRGADEPVDVSGLRPGIYRVILQDARGQRAATLLKE